MDMSVFDLFKIGIGPSSSHTVGPMVAARRFLVECGPLDKAVGVEAALYGSLALTGVGHATDKAVILGLMGETPQDIDPDTVEDKLAEAELDGVHPPARHQGSAVRAATGLLAQAQSLPEHPNGMRFTLKLADGSVIETRFLLGRRWLHPRGRRSAARARTRAAATPLPLPVRHDGPAARARQDTACRSRTCCVRTSWRASAKKSSTRASTRSGRSCATVSPMAW